MTFFTLARPMRRVVSTVFFIGLSAAIGQAQEVRLPAKETLSIHRATSSKAELVVGQVGGADELTASTTTMPMLVTPIPKVVDQLQEGPPGVKVGSTWYDFQCNGAMANRILVTNYETERYIQMLWMAATDSTRDANSRVPGFNNSRGSYFAAFDASDLMQPVPFGDWSKVEPANQRFGWPSIVQFSNGVVGTPSHTPVTWWRNPEATDPTFSRFTVASEADSALWPRAAVTADDNVHLIYNRAISGNEGNRTVYRRSVNRGTTWEPETPFTGPVALGGGANGLPVGGGGDSYAIAARGNTVAVLYVDGRSNLWIRLSRDGGNTWPRDTNHTRVVWVPFAEYDTVITPSVQRRTTPTSVTPNSSMDLIIDSQGSVHFAFSAFFASLGASRTSINEDFRDTIYPESVTGDEFRNRCGIYYGTFGGNSIELVGIPGGSGWDGQGFFANRRANWGNAVTPQFGIDSGDNLYMVFASMKNGDTKNVTLEFSRNNIPFDSTVSGLNMHVYATYKLRGVQQWLPPVDLTPVGFNCQWTTLCDDVIDNTLLIGYAANTTPGDHVTNVTLPSELTDIYLLPLKRETLGTINSLGETLPETMPTTTLAPNPAQSYVAVRGTGVTEGLMNLSITTMVGATVWTSTVATSAGTPFEVTIPTGTLANGAYVVVMETERGRTSQILNVIR